jgi:hypothetical protein
MRFSFESAGRKPIGTGNEKEVFVDPADDERVIAVFKEKQGLTEGIKHSPRNLKGAFYLMKIAHLLLPENVPDIYQAGESIDGQQTMDRERIEHSEGHAALQAARLAELDYAAKIEAKKEAGVQIEKEMGSDSKKIIEKLGRIGFAHATDNNWGNFSKDSDGTTSYLDTLMPWKQIDSKTIDLNFDEKRMRTAIRGLKDQGQRGTGEAYLERTLALYEEEKQHLLDNPIDAAPGIRHIEELLAAYGTEHDLARLRAIENREEALASEERKAARRDHSRVFVELQTLKKSVDITPEDDARLTAALKEIDAAIGAVRGDGVDHSMR